MSIEIKVLGPGCANCKRLYAEAADAVAQLSVAATITKVEDFREIMSYKILATPALVINAAPWNMRCSKASLRREPRLRN